MEKSVLNRDEYFQVVLMFLNLDYSNSYGVNNDRKRQE